jgi:hypothetical protein
LRRQRVDHFERHHPPRKIGADLPAFDNEVRDDAHARGGGGMRGPGSRSFVSP